MAYAGRDTVFGRPQSDKYINSVPSTGTFGSGNTAPGLVVAARPGHVSSQEVYIGSPSMSSAWAPDSHGSTRVIAGLESRHIKEPERVVAVSSREHEPVVISYPNNDHTGLVEGSLSVINGFANDTSNAVRDVGGNILVKPVAGTLNIWADLVVDSINVTKNYVAKPIIGTVSSTLAIGRDYVAEPMGAATAETVFFGWDYIIKPCGELILKPCVSCPGLGLGCCCRRIEIIEVPVPTYEVRRPVSEVLPGHYVEPSSSRTLNQVLPPGVGLVRDEHVYHTMDLTTKSKSLFGSVVEGPVVSIGHRPGEWRS
mmetsp:Transcript_44133/g.116789  ORF Transcript_44133/g.116789 Transcript_44133/m.116789 type:complete len:312 (-) Transcript_44133:261-1196(-)